MRQLIHQQDRRMARECRIQIEFRAAEVTIANGQRRQSRQALRSAARFRCAHAARCNPATTSVPGGAHGARRLEHGVGLADAGGCAEENPQMAAPRPRLLGLDMFQQLIRIGSFHHEAQGYLLRAVPGTARTSSSAQVQRSVTLTRGSPKNAQPALLRCARRSRSHRLRAQAAHSRHARRLVVGRGETLLRVKPAGGCRHQVHRDRRVIARVGGTQGLNACLDAIRSEPG